MRTRGRSFGKRRVSRSYGSRRRRVGTNVRKSRNYTMSRGGVRL